MIWLNQILSRSADSLIYCTEQSMKQHEMLGFARGCGVVIGNGFDTERYRPRANARAVIAARSGISDEDLIIGHVGRYDVAKGHGYLLEAFSRVHARYPRARLVCAGRGVDHHNADLVAQIRRLEIASAVTLLGEFSPIEDLYPAFDILCSSSIAEGFPNVVAEAMASGVPCVVTDTGASRVLVEGVGEVVQTRSSEDLARGLCSLCATSATERREYGVLARDKIRELHSMKAVSERYANLYRGMYDRDRSRAGEIDKGDMAQSVGVA
jgi:glycosyltransferase involved in cell wall biosynthesis